MNAKEGIVLQLRGRGRGQTKSREGCFTCKKRRVKCDERRPSCLRCERYKTHCEGYPNRRKAVPSQSRSLLPKSQDASTAIVVQPAIIKFADQREHRYFISFWKDLAPSTDLANWSDLILQTSHSEPAIQRAVIALGATKTPHDGSTGLWNHKAQALQYYHGALASMRQSIHTVRTALIACILTVCFEIYNHRLDLAVAAAQSGLKLVENWLISKAAKAASIPEARQSMSPDPYEVEDALVDLFLRLDARILALGGKGTALLVHNLVSGPADAPTFWDLKEASTALGNLMVDLFHFTTTENYARANAAAAAATHSPTAQTTVPWTIVSWQPAQATKRQIVNDKLFKWKTGFESLLHKRSLPVSPKDVLTVISLKLGHLHLMHLLETSPTPGEMQYDSMQEDFRLMIDYCTQLLSSQQYTQEELFVSFGVLAPLFCVGLRCRDRPTRRQAVKLSQSLKRREGFWTSETVAAVISWASRVEEDGLADEVTSIPIENRIFLVGLKLDWDLREVRWVCRYAARWDDNNVPVERGGVATLTY